MWPGVAHRLVRFLSGQRAPRAVPAVGGGGHLSDSEDPREVWIFEGTLFSLVLCMFNSNMMHTEPFNGDGHWLKRWKKRDLFA